MGRYAAYLFCSGQARHRAVRWVVLEVFLLVLSLRKSDWNPDQAETVLPIFKPKNHIEREMNTVSVNIMIRLILKKRMC